MIVTGAYAAKTRLSEFLDSVIAGKRVRITSGGVPVAELRPVSSRKERVKTVLEEIAQLRKGVRLGNLSIRELIEEGRS
jgi:prevent-host-death family protein